MGDWRFGIGDLETEEGRDTGVEIRERSVVRDPRRAIRDLRESWRSNAPQIGGIEAVR
jgi:hypothetical protein